MNAMRIMTYEYDIEKDQTIVEFRCTEEKFKGIYPLIPSQKIEYICLHTYEMRFEGNKTLDQVKGTLSTVEDWYKIILQQPIWTYDEISDILENVADGKAVKKIILREQILELVWFEGKEYLPSKYILDSPKTAELVDVKIRRGILPL